MTKSTEFTHLLRDTLSLSTIVGQFVSLKKKGREYTGLCPFHEEKGPSFTVNEEKGFYHCFGCGAHGDIFNFVMQKLNMPFRDALEYLADQANLSIPSFEAPKESAVRQDHTPLYKIMEDACQWFERNLRHPHRGERARNYLINRQITGVTAKKFRIGYAPESGLWEFLLTKGYEKSLLINLNLVGHSEHSNHLYDRFRSRIMFPIKDRQGKIIAFGGRVIEEGDPKYLNSSDTPLFSKGHQLYALHAALPSARQAKPFVVVEGYMDVIRLHQEGMDSAVAPLGTAITTEQLHLLWRTSPCPILCFDGDSAGRRAALRAAYKALEILKPGNSLSFAFLKEGEDPDSYTRQYGMAAFEGVLSHANSMIDVLWADFMNQHDISTPEHKAKVRKDILVMTDKIGDPDVKHFYRQDFNNRFHLLLSDLYHKKGKDFGGTLKRLGGGFLSQQKKNDDGQKILLATLINHPTLLSQVIEQVMELTFEEKILDDLRQKLLEIYEESLDLTQEVLKKELKQNGFSHILDKILCQEIYCKARFSHPSASLEHAHEGWVEVWRTLKETEDLKQEMNQAVHQASTDLNEHVWQRLKVLKKTLVVQKNKGTLKWVED